VYHEWGPGWGKRARLLEEFWPISNPAKRKTFGILLVRAEDGKFLLNSNGKLKVC